MAEQTTAAIWATDMAELTGCDQTIWVHAETVLPESEFAGAAMGLEYPDAVRREQLELQLRGSMAGHTMYAVPLAPGIEEPWVLRGLLLTDDPSTARWFAALPGAEQSDTLSAGDCLRVLHLSHTTGQVMAALPKEHTLWALGTDIESLCRGIDLGLASFEGRWGDWLTMPLTVNEGVGIISREGKPHWLQIGPDGKMWAADPWAAAAPVRGLEHLIVAMPELGSGLCHVTWPTLVHCAILSLRTPETGILGMEAWYYDGIVKLVNQWAHTEDVIPRMPQCYVGDPAAWPAEAELEPCPLGEKPVGTEFNMALLQELTEQVAATLTDASLGRLPPHMVACLERLRKA